MAERTRTTSTSDPEVEIGRSAAVAPMPPGTGELAPGVVTVLSPRVRRIVAPNPSMMTGPGTGTYLVGTSEIAVIDPGPKDKTHLDRIAEVGDGRIRWVLYTHTHQDHSPGVAGLVKRTGAQSIGFPRRPGHKGDPKPRIPAHDGFRLSLEDATLDAVHTPGHASNHLCWLLREERMLFSGDHIMNGSTVVIAPPDGNMTDYIEQLNRLKAMRLRSIAPGHGRLITKPKAKIDEYLSHRLDREQQVAERLTDAPTTIADIVAAIYTETPEALLPVARHSVWAHLLRLKDAGRADSTDPASISGEWVASKPGQ